MNSFVGPCFSIPPKRSIYKLGWIGDGLLVCLPHYTIWLYLICPGDCAWQWQISHCCRFWSKVISLKSYDFPAMLNFKNWMTALFLQQIPIVGGKKFRSFQDFCSTHTQRVALWGAYQSLIGAVKDWVHTDLLHLFLMGKHWEYFRGTGDKPMVSTLNQWQIDSFTTHIWRISGELKFQSDSSQTTGLKQPGHRRLK